MLTYDAVQQLTRDRLAQRVAEADAERLVRRRRRSRAAAAVAYTVDAAAFAAAAIGTSGRTSIAP